MTMFSRFATYFDEVARYGSIRKAAEILHIAPSAINRHILRAEEMLGAPLFERQPKGLRLTAVGELLVGQMRGWRRDYDRLRTQIEEMKGLRQGEIKLALVEGAAGFAAGQLREFHRDYPRITYRVHMGTPAETAGLVRSGDVDFGLVFDPATNDRLCIEHAAISCLGVVVPPDHPLTALNAVRLANCIDYPLALPEETQPLRATIDAAWQSHFGATPCCTLTADSCAMIKSFVRQGLGVALLSRLDVLDETRSGALKFLPLADEAIPLATLSLIRLRARPLSAIATQMMEYFGDAMAGIGMTSDVPGAQPGAGLNIWS